MLGMKQDMACGCKIAELMNSIVSCSSLAPRLNYPYQQQSRYSDRLKESAWLSFPCNVLQDEVPLKWVVRPPNYKTYSQKDIDTFHKVIKVRAQRIRAITGRIICADVTNPDTLAILEGVQLHLQSVTALILRDHEKGRFARAQWELQMACESAFKGVLLQHTGKFPEHHDLFVL